MRNQRLDWLTIGLLLSSTVLWAGNTIVGRVISEMIPPITLNFVRWLLAFVFLLPFGASVLRASSSIWRKWHRYALLGLLGVGFYNAFQYLALHTSTPINVTLVGASMPIWTLLVGRLFFKANMRKWQVIGALVSLFGVCLILTRGDLSQLFSLHFVVGDLFMILATIAWAFYSWLLTTGEDEEDVRSSWASLLLAQVVFGVMWSAVFAVGEWALTDWVIHWNPTLLWSLLYVSTGPAIVAFCCWGAGVRRVGPATAGFFANFIPLFTAVLSVIILGELPRLFHVLAFLLIVSGIVLASRRPA